MRRLSWMTIPLLAACSTGAPEEVLLITGRVEGGGGVQLERRLAPGCFQEPAAGTAEEAFQPVQGLETGADGQFAFEVYRAQARPGGDRIACFRIHSDTHPRTELRTQLGATDARLPALVGWDLPPTRGPDGWEAPAVPELPEGNLFGAQAQEWQLETGFGPAWRVWGTQPFAPSPELFEDFPRPSLALLARAYGMDHDASEGLLFARTTESQLTLRTPAVALDSPPVIPLTRNAECRVGEIPWAGCPWVDGRLDRVRAGPGDSPLTQLQLRWSQARTVRTLVVRGLEHEAPQVRVEVAEGEGDWVEVAVLELASWDPDLSPARALGTPGRWEQLALPPVRADRLRLTAVEGSISGVRELSVFE